MSRFISLVLIALFVLISSRGFAQVYQYTASNFPETYDGVFYPGVELRELPTARAQAVASRVRMRQVESNLNASIEDLRLQFEQSPQWEAAMIAQRDAFANLSVARAHAILELRDDASYRAAVALRDRLASQIRGGRDNNDSRETLLAMATLKLSYGIPASAMEAAAVAADPRVQQARAQLLAAGERLTALRREFDQQVRSNQTLLATRRDLNEARVAAIASDAFYQETKSVAAVAVDYSYSLSRPNNYSPFAGYGFGYPTGYPYSWPGRP